MSMAGRCMAARTAAGTLVGPGMPGSPRPLATVMFGLPGLTVARGAGRGKILVGSRVIWKSPPNGGAAVPAAGRRHPRSGASAAGGDELPRAPRALGCDRSDDSSYLGATRRPGPDLGDRGIPRAPLREALALAHDAGRRAGVRLCRGWLDSAGPPSVARDGRSRYVT